MSVDSEILLEIDFLVITPSNDSNLDFPGHILKISQNQSPAHKFENFQKKITGPLNAGQEFSICQRLGVAGSLVSYAYIHQY